MHTVIRKLEKYVQLSAGEKTALLRAFATDRTLDAGDSLGSAGDSVTYLGALVAGHLCRQNRMRNGSRQLLSLPLAGDTIEMQSASLDWMDYSVVALTPCKVALASREAVVEMLEEQPRLEVLLMRNVAIEASISRQWIASLAGRSAYARLAHLFCELFARMADAGLTLGASYAMPLTQADLADATGLSNVHVNRMLKRLRSEDLISLQRGQCTVTDWKGLVRVGGFDPSYLHLSETYSAPPVSVRLPTS